MTVEEPLREGGAGPGTRGGRVRRLLGELVPILALTPVLALIAAGFVAPWLSSSPVRGSDLDHYAPSRDGSAYLTLQRGRDEPGDVWRSDNVRRVPGLKASTEWRSGAAGALDAFVAREDAPDPAERSRRLQRLDAIQVDIRELHPEGVRASELYSVVDRDGQWLLAFHDAASGTDTVLDPPLLVLPRDLPVGATWESEGTFGGGGARYVHRGEVRAQGAHATALGPYDDCIEIEERFTVLVEGAATSQTTSRAWSCAGVGAVVDAVDVDAAGRTTASRVLVSSDAAGGAVADDLPDLAGVPTVDCGSAEAPCADGPAAAHEPRTWSFRRVGSAQQSFSGAEATVPPLWIPTDPPLVLTAAAGGDLVAFDPAAGAVAWRFHPAGTIQGPPVFASGRILFGATDKKLYAIDGRGMFLWSHRTSDSVPTRPLVVGGTVVVGSEDRDVHGVDLETGRPVWRTPTRGPIASTPAAVAGMVVIGSDDGALRVLDPSTGDVLATTSLGGAIVAPVVPGPADTLAVAATTEGTIATVEIPSGDVRWQTAVGSPVRQAPAVHDGRLYVVDDGGVVTILDAEDGAILATAPGTGYAGAPLALPQGVLVTTSGGGVELLGPDGDTSATWDAADAQGVSDALPSYAVGPTSGGGAVWTVDRTGVLRRLGPEDAVGAVASLAPAWIRTLTEEPFLSNGSTPVTTPLEWNGGALGIDGGGGVLLTDPEDGETAVLGTIEGYTPYVDPVVVGDRLLVAGPRSLRALTLPELELQWEVAGAGAAARPPVVSGDTVLYASGSMNEGTGPRLDAVDLGTGAGRWSVPFGPTPLAGGVVVADGLVIGGSPVTAYDLRTGDVVWRTEDHGEATLGGPGMADATVYVATLAIDGSDRSTLTAIEVATGGVRWSVDLGDRALDLTDAVEAVDDVVIVPTLDGGVLARAAVDGSEVWNHQPTPPVLGNVEVTDGTVWFVLENGHLQVLDAASGATLVRSTELDFPLESQGRTQRPARVGGHVLVSLGYFLVGFDHR